MCMVGVEWSASATTRAAAQDHKSRSVDAPTRLRVKSNARRSGKPVTSLLWLAAAGVWEAATQQRDVLYQ